MCYNILKIFFDEKPRSFPRVWAVCGLARLVPGHHLITLSTAGRRAAGGGHLEAAEEMIITLADTFRHGRLAGVCPGEIDDTDTARH